MSNADENVSEDGQPKKGSLATRIGILAGVVVLVVVGAIAFVNRGNDAPEVTASPEPTQTDGMTRHTGTPTESTPPPSTPASPPATPSAQPSTPADQVCTTADGGFQPSELEIPDLDVTSNVMSVAYDDNGNPGAPPLDDSHGTAWFNGSAEPGSSEGTSMLNIHTYRNGGALGNQLLDELNPGAALEVSDGSGNTSCYEVYDRVKVHVDTVTDEELDRLHADSGDPEAVIVVCDDFNWDEEYWETRVLWYAKQV